MVKMVITQEFLNKVLDCLACIELHSHEDLDAYFNEENFEIPQAYLDKASDYARKKFLEIMREFETDGKEWRVVS